MKSSLTALTALTALGVLLGFTAPAHASPITQTSAAWRVTPTLPGVGWNTSLLFNDSGWEFATELYSVNSYHPTYDPGTKGIWSSGGQFSTTQTAIWARSIFTLSVLPTSASLRGAFDDDGEIYINGVLVLTDADGGATNLSISNVLPYLVLGSNLIAYHVTDNFQVWGYNHASYLEINGQFPAPIPEPSTWLLLGTGLAVVAVRRRLTKRT